MYAGSLFLITVLKREFRVECIRNTVGTVSEELRPIAIACMVLVAFVFAASAFIMSHIQAPEARASTIFSKWQSAYFVIVSLQKLFLNVTVAIASELFEDDRIASGCPMNDTIFDLQAQSYTISLIWDAAVLFTGVLTMFCDLNATLSPAMRRLAYAFFAVSLLVDVVGSVLWGNLVASSVSVSFGNVRFALDGMITVCIFSQAALAWHFLFTALRSRRGRGWLYAPLKFELLHSGQLTATQVAHAADEAVATVPPTAAVVPNPEAQIPSAFALYVRSWQQLQKRLAARCRVFSIPCTAKNGVGNGEAEFEISRPFFDLRLLRPLQRLADGNANIYIAFGAIFLGVPNIACNFFLLGRDKGIANTVLNSLMSVMLFGLLSSKKYGVDQFAVKHIVRSFRFAVFAALLLGEIAVYTVSASTNKHRRHPTETAAGYVRILCFLQCILLDVSPHLPASSQILITVSARIVPQRFFFDSNVA
jgi:hypothetical protein